MDSTTNIEETTRPACRCCGEAPAGVGGICDECAPSEYHGYEADEDHALYWDQHAEG